MGVCKTVLEFQPRKVGDSAHNLQGVANGEQSAFMQLLEQAYRQAGNGRARVSLVELQFGLLRRGWHP